MCIHKTYVFWVYLYSYLTLWGLTFSVGRMGMEVPCFAIIPHPCPPIKLIQELLEGRVTPSPLIPKHLTQCRPCGRHLVNGHLVSDGSSKKFIKKRHCKIQESKADIQVLKRSLLH